MSRYKLAAWSPFSTIWPFGEVEWCSGLLTLMHSELAVVQDLCPSRPPHAEVRLATMSKGSSGIWYFIIPHY